MKADKKRTSGSRREWKHIDFPENLPPVNIKEVMVGLYEPMEGLYKVRVERARPLPEKFAEVCRFCAAILMAEECADG